MALGAFAFSWCKNIVKIFQVTVTLSFAKQLSFYPLECSPMNSPQKSSDEDDV